MWCKYLVAREALRCDVENRSVYHLTYRGTEHHTIAVLRHPHAGPLAVVQGVVSGDAQSIVVERVEALGVVHRKIPKPRGRESRIARHNS